VGHSPFLPILALHFLQHRSIPFIIRTDHQSLQYMEGMEPPSEMIMRWFDTLSNFNFSIEHRPGNKQANADALSRCAHAEEPDPDDESDEMIAMMHEMINVLEPCVPDWDPTHVRSQQLMDSDLEMIRTAVRTATKPLLLSARAFSPEGRAYVGLFEQLFFDEHDVLCRRIPNLIARSCRNLSVMFRDDELAYPSICGKQQLSMFMRDQPTRGRQLPQKSSGMRSSSHS
jgi:hypothetical protein